MSGLGAEHPATPKPERNGKETWTVKENEPNATIAGKSVTVTGRATIRNLQGFHFRPVGKLTQMAQQFASDIRIDFNGTTVNGKSALECALLGAPQGSVLELTATGPDADEAVRQLAELIENRFGMTDTD